VADAPRGAARGFGLDAKNPNKIDKYVGERMRTRRKELKLSQEALAALLGITFQQIQKYERGTNRISAGRLFELARALRTTIPYFYDGHEGVSKAMLRGVADEGADFGGPMDPEAVDLVTAFQSIADPDLRRSILAMVKQAATTGRKKKGSSAKD
jgi:transcriptional regulator with XRE-family HTH domain